MAILQLQQTVGNQTTVRLLRSQPIQTRTQRGDARIQRTCGSSNIATLVAGRAGCTDQFDDTFVSGSVFRFNKNCDDFSSTPTPQETALITFAKGLAVSDNVEIHGYASVAGTVDFNKDLACARGLKAHQPRPGCGTGAAAPKRRHQDTCGRWRREQQWRWRHDAGSHASNGSVPRSADCMRDRRRWLYDTGQHPDARRNVPDHDRLPRPGAH